MARVKAFKPIAATTLAGALCVAAMALPSAPFADVAQATTYSDLVNAQNQTQASKEREANLRSQLANVDSALADKIVELDDLTNNQIPAAQAKVDAANSAAADAAEAADAAASRLSAAQDDKKNLEQQIKETGENYDDAHAAVAQMARESMHGSDTSDVMSVVTGSKTTADFIQSMQSRDAVSRSEANAASDYANDLSTSMTRSERLDAIEKRIQTLKSEADQKSAAAQSAAASAEEERQALDSLRAEGETKRAELESQKSSLNDSAAAAAAETVLLQSQVDSLNRQYAAEQAAAAARVQSTVQAAPVSTTTTASSSSSSSSGVVSKPANTGSSSGSSGSSGGSNAGSSSSAGTAGAVTQPSTSGSIPASDYVKNNLYPWGQCTWWAYEWRLNNGYPAYTYFGNARDWGYNARARGYTVNNTPSYGAIIVFQPGQAGADATYGHVGVVVGVSGSTITISESNVAGLGVISSRTLSNAYAYTYIH